jgi:hypothetical protein
MNLAHESCKTGCPDPKLTFNLAHQAGAGQPHRSYLADQDSTSDCLQQGPENCVTASLVPGHRVGNGASTYNTHRDGSGICYSSQRRPLLTMRPGYITYFDRRGSGLRHFPADTHLVDWLTTKSFGFDVVTDHDLDCEGAALLKPYLAGRIPEPRRGCRPPPAQQRSRPWERQARHT